MIRFLRSYFDGKPSISSASLGIFRIIFGGVMCFSLSRFILSGWVEELWVRPTFFFKYTWGQWMPVWEPSWLYLHICLTLLGAFGVWLDSTFDIL